MAAPDTEMLRIFPSIHMSTSVFSPLVRIESVSIASTPALLPP